MNEAGSREYLRSVVMSAPPEKLQLMLYDGAIRFCRQARDAISARRIEDGYNLITRAQNIVLELNNALKPELAPQLCERMAALYNYLYRRLIHANMHRDLDALDEALRLIEYQRETWIMLLEKLASESESPVERSTPAPTSTAAIRQGPKAGARIPPGQALAAGPLSLEGDRKSVV